MRNPARQQPPLLAPRSKRQLNRHQGPV